MAKIIAFGDTHGDNLFFYTKIPYGDILICIGDFSGYGTAIDVSVFNEDIKRLKSKIGFKHVIIVPGNHDCFMEQAYNVSEEMLEDVICLFDKEIVIDGIKFWGTPWTLEFNNWSFMGTEKDLEYYFRYIPSDTDVIISHGPPYGILDQVKGGPHLGSIALRDRILQVKPKLVLFGHIHDAYGMLEKDAIIYANVSLLNERYALVNLPQIFNIKGEKHDKR